MEVTSCWQPRRLYDTFVLPANLNTAAAGDGCIQAIAGLTPDFSNDRQRERDLCVPMS